jgi:2'-5' RNA ligase
MLDETALILPVPDAEALVGRWRAKYDSSAAVGVPAHMTLLYPFLWPGEVRADDVAGLTTIFASTPPLDVVFRRTGRFEPRVLFLAPEPEAPLLALMRRIWERWPECPPYHGTIAAADVRPHLTVADGPGAEHLDRIGFAVGDGLPLATRLAEGMAHRMPRRLVDGAHGIRPQVVERRRAPGGARRCRSLDQ